MKIKSKKVLGIRKVYDLTVPGTHSFCLKNGVVVHNCETDKTVLEIEHTTERGIIAKETTRDEVSKMFNEVIEAEFAFIDYLFSEGRSLVGTNSNLVKQWVLFNAKDVANFLKLETDHKFPKNNPMPHLEMWLNMNKQQAAPQEQDIVAYKVGISLDNLGDEIIDF